MDDFVVSLDELAGAPRSRAEVGGKAFYLARLLAAGLPVPEGVVVTTAAARLGEDELVNIFRYLDEVTATMGGTFAVRSSAVMEDGVAAAAPGVFSSMCHVEPAAVADAVRAVWASAEAPLVRAYAEARGIDELPMAVIVQRQVPGEPLTVAAAARGSATLASAAGSDMAAGVLYTRLPGHESGDQALIETRFRIDQAPALLRIPRDGPLPQDGARAEARDEGRDAALSRDTIAALRELGMRAEQAIGAEGGADVEWVAGGGRIWLVQARPIVHPQRATPRYPEALLQFSRTEPERVWRLDVTHNPEPLSQAQAGLVERVDRAGLAPYRMRVVGGYLYVADSERAPQAEEVTADRLRERFAGELRPAMEAALAQGQDAGLGAALSAYDRFYALYAGQLGPLISRARRVLPGFLQERLGEDGERLASELLADGSPARLEALIDRAAGDEIPLAEVLAEAGAMSPAWDVASATFAEHPEILRQAVDHARQARAPERAAARDQAARARAALVRARLDAGDAARFDECLALARQARDIGEIDDRLYARAQAAVRGALLRQARAWRLLDDDDVFHLPLDHVLAWSEQAHGPDPVHVHRMAQAGRAARERQRAWVMPLAFAGGRPVADTAAGGRDVWHGRGAGGTARGTAVRLADMSAQPELGPDSIVVVPTVTPAMAFGLQRAAAIVAEHGGLLDHGAAMARELGIPCVVACASAWAEIRTGDSLWLDGDAGVVVRTTPTHSTQG